MRTAPGIILLIEFDWPQPITPEHAHNARRLHDLTQDQDWIREIIAGSGGVGAGPHSLWVFWLDGYAALERLLSSHDDPIAMAYRSCFDAMAAVSSKIRTEVRFL